MKLIILAGLLMAMSSGVFAQTRETFNTRPGIEQTELINSLENNCWDFKNFTVTNANNADAIEGNGSLASASNTNLSEIYTPVLHIKGETNIAFSYKLINASASDHQIRIFLTDADNRVVLQLDSIMIDGNSTAIKTYTKHFPSLSIPGSIKFT